MSKVIQITSQSHFKQITGSSTYTVVDFYADWCGPCKTIAPVFEQLATAEAKPGRLSFVKVNVDSQQDVASTYGISAMPTFLILKGSSVKETIRGANPSALRTAVLSAAADAAKGPAKASASFSTTGRTLGASDASAGRAGASRQVAGDMLPNFGAMLSSPGQFAQGRGWAAALVRFVGLYLTSLFAMEPAQAAQSSPFALQRSQAGRTMK